MKLGVSGKIINKSRGGARTKPVRLRNKLREQCVGRLPPGPLCTQPFGCESKTALVGGFSCAAHGATDPAKPTDPAAVVGSVDIGTPLRIVLTLHVSADNCAGGRNDVSVLANWDKRRRQLRRTLRPRGFDDA